MKTHITTEALARALLDLVARNGPQAIWLGPVNSEGADIMTIYTNCRDHEGKNRGNCSSEICMIFWHDKAKFPEVPD